MISEIDSRQGYQPPRILLIPSFLGPMSSVFPTLSSACLSESASRSLNCDLDGRDLDCHALEGRDLDCHGHVALEGRELDCHALDCHVLDGCTLDGYALDWLAPGCNLKLQSIVGRENNFCLEDKYICHVELIKETRTDIFDQLLQFARFDNLGFTRRVF